MTISEVSKKYDITADTLRWYERIGILKDIPRSAGGLREYNEANCSRIEFIKCMRKAGLSIEFLIEYLTLLEQGDSTLEARKNLLIEQKTILLKKMEEMEDTLKRLDFKIEHYNNLCNKK